tara:strand:+ start:520 stop:1317 length:798 start_codon:yes stop_codon:yes gene_type:complete
LSRNFTVVTTFNEQGLAAYGERFLAAFDQHWPAEVTLYAYHEGKRPDFQSSRITYLDLEASCPDLVAFKARHRHDAKTQGTLEDGDYGYRMDAVRFAHKIFALTHCGLAIVADVLFWLDADTITFADVPLSVLDQVLPEGVYTSYLGRPHTYSECGFVGYALSHPHHREFMEFWRQLYLDDSLFELPEWHDSFVYDVIRKTFEDKLADFKTHNIAANDPPSDHPFINSVLGQYMDHLKGDSRKEAGKSFEDDLMQKRDEEYWKES